MIKTVKFVSQLHMENREDPCANTAIISITSPGDFQARIKTGFHDILRLQFDDIYEEIIQEMIGAIPDVDNTSAGIFWHHLRLPDANHAKTIVDFLNRIQCERLIVHCHAGISRSAAIAKFVSDRMGAELEEFEDTSCANKRVLRLLNKIYDGDVITVGKFYPTGEMATVGDQDEFDFDFQWLKAQIKPK